MNIPPPPPRFGAVLVPSNEANLALKTQLQAQQPYRNLSYVDILRNIAQVAPTTKCVRGEWFSSVQETGEMLYKANLPDALISQNLIQAGFQNVRIIPDADVGTQIGP